MFRVVCFVDDRKLGECLRVLAGLAHGHPEVQPVVNVEKHGSTLKAASNGNAADQFVVYARQHKLDTINAQVSKQWLRKMGRSELSSTYILTTATKQGALKKIGKGNGTSYTLQPAKR